jgi:hypothetical protein
MFRRILQLLLILPLLVFLPLLVEGCRKSSTLAKLQDDASAATTGCSGAAYAGNIHAAARGRSFGQSDRVLFSQVRR